MLYSKILNRAIFVAIGVVLAFSVLHFCEDRGVSETITYKDRIIKITDTLKVKNNKIVTKYKTVYVRKTDTSLVYLDKPDTTSIIARVYNQPIEGRRVKGIAHITTTGELLDFCSEVEVKDTIRETTITKYRDRSKAFVSASYNTNNQLNLGIDWNIKNKILLKGGIGYETQTLKPYISLGIGIPIF